jgi:hypothetical protein
MKRTLPIILLAILAVIAARANDGVFYASGGTLMPLQESSIALRKELLKFYVVDYEFARVEVDFEFYNPGNARTLTVGFVTPPAEGDVLDEEAEHPFISDFTVNVNGRPIPFKIKKMSETTFKMGDAGVEGRDFVYYFPVTFKPGINRIRHTYRYRGGMSVELQRDFDYQITTGKRWANGQIDDFELQIHPDNGIFALVSSFQTDESPANWQIVGDGVIASTPRTWFMEENPKVRMFHLNNGYLKFTAKNFKPDNDLFFGEYNWAAGWIDIWCHPKTECEDRESLQRIAGMFDVGPPSEIEDDAFDGLTATELKRLRNYYFAVRGVPFQDPEIRSFFERFFWYKPNAKVKAGTALLSRTEKMVVARIAARESKLKK